MHEILNILHHEVFLTEVSISSTFLPIKTLLFWRRGPKLNFKKISENKKKLKKLQSLII